MLAKRARLRAELEALEKPDAFRGRQTHFAEEDSELARTVIRSPP
jgi:hypothetical protein